MRLILSTNDSKEERPPFFLSAGGGDRDGNRLHYSAVPNLIDNGARGSAALSIPCARATASFENPGRLGGERGRWNKGDEKATDPEKHSCVVNRPRSRDQLGRQIPRRIDWQPSHMLPHWPRWWWGTRALRSVFSIIAVCALGSRVLSGPCAIRTLQPESSRVQRSGAMTTHIVGHTTSPRRRPLRLRSHTSDPNPTRTSSYTRGHESDSMVLQGAASGNRKPYAFISRLG
jgi:hypothetical protein